MTAGIPAEKIYSSDKRVYKEKSISARLEALFLNNIGLVVTRERIIEVATDPISGRVPENWHQRLSELRTDKGYTILAQKDWKVLSPSEYVMPHPGRRPTAAKRVMPTRECWDSVLKLAKGRCQWMEDGQPCGLANGDIDPIGGGTVRLTPDHLSPHSINPDIDPANPAQWQALCGRHQVTKKNYWDGASGKINLLGILQHASTKQKAEALQFLLDYHRLVARKRD